MDKKYDDFLELQYSYFLKIKEQNPAISDKEVMVKYFPPGWFSNGDLSTKTRLLETAIREKKNLSDIEELAQLDNYKPVRVVVSKK